MDYQVNYKTSVDDYEHEGDFENERRFWSNLGFRVKDAEYNRDMETYTYSVVGTISDKIIQEILSDVVGCIKTIKGQRCQDWSEVQNPYELINLLEACDRQNGTKFAENYKNIIKGVESYYCDGGEIPTNFSPITIENIVQVGRRGVSNAQMIPAIKSALEEKSQAKLNLLKSTYGEVFQSSIKYLSKKQQEEIKGYI